VTRGKRTDRRRESLLPEAARPGKKASGRQMQVADAVRQEISQMLLDGSIKDPRLHNTMVTITDAEMTPDLRIARVYFSVFPSDDEVLKNVLKGLRSASKEIKRELSMRLELRSTPDVEFFLDKSVAEGAKIEGILREIRESEDGEE
jgi:ribosome-binding factor A